MHFVTGESQWGMQGARPLPRGSRGGAEPPLALVDRAVALGIAALCCKASAAILCAPSEDERAGSRGGQLMARWASCSRPLAFCKTFERQLDGLAKRCGLFQRKVPTLYWEVYFPHCWRRWASEVMSVAHHESDRRWQRDAQRRKCPRLADGKER